MGLSTRKAVLIIYALSTTLCVSSLLLIILHSQGIAIFLASLAVVSLLFLKKLGYLQYIGAERVRGWIRDVSDEAGLSRDRRSFLNLQLEICSSRDLGQLWRNTCQALTMLDFDMSRIQIANHADKGNSKPDHSAGHTDPRIPGTDFPEREPDNAGEADRDMEWVWTYNGFDPDRYSHRECMFKLELPLVDDRNNQLGTLWLVKDLRRTSFSHYTLKRVEHLRRSVTRTLKKLMSEGGGSP
jgi:UDP-GlcNAc:undecaprenyl-phosphate GlcNAc-1-phosphate transferase